MSNNSMDVRAKQLLCFYVTLFPSRCVRLVFAHVISTVGRLSNFSNNRFLTDNQKANSKDKEVNEYGKDIKKAIKVKVKSVKMPTSKVYVETCQKPSNCH